MECVLLPYLEKLMKTTIDGQHGNCSYGCATPYHGGARASGSKRPCLQDGNANPATWLIRSGFQTWLWLWTLDVWRRQGLSSAGFHIALFCISRCHALGWFWHDGGSGVIHAATSLVEPVPLPTNMAVYRCTALHNFCYCFWCIYTNTIHATSILGS